MQKYFDKIKEQLEEEKKAYSELVSVHFGQRNSRLAYVYKEKELAINDAIEIVKEVVEEFAADINVGHKNGWIPCSEKLPEDGDNRFYMCIVENHEEDLPMFCQFVEELGFGYWQDIFDKDSLGFVDSEFSTNEELGYEKVIAWQPLPEPYKEVER